MTTNPPAPPLLRGGIGVRQENKHRGWWPDAETLPSGQQCPEDKKAKRSVAKGAQVQQSFENSRASSGSGAGLHLHTATMKTVDDRGGGPAGALEQNPSGALSPLPMLPPVLAALAQRGGITRGDPILGSTQQTAQAVPPYTPPMHLQLQQRRYDPLAHCRPAVLPPVAVLPPMAAPPPQRYHPFQDPNAEEEGEAAPLMPLLAALEITAQQPLLFDPVAHAPQQQPRILNPVAHAPQQQPRILCAKQLAISSVQSHAHHMGSMAEQRVTADSTSSGAAGAVLSRASELAGPPSGPEDPDPASEQEETIPDLELEQRAGALLEMLGHDTVSACSELIFIYTSSRNAVA